jgi:hypothetical protein
MAARNALFYLERGLLIGWVNGIVFALFVTTITHGRIR